MKKAFVLSALALAAAGAAHAEMSLYGLIDVSYGKSIGDDIAGLKADLHSGGDNGSSNGNSTTRFGLKGSTDVGSGLKANFKLESNGIEIDGSIPAPFFQRQAWVGLSGSFGEVRVGRQDSVAFQTMIDYDFNGASNGVSALGYAQTAPWLRGRQSRSIQYISPNMGGVGLHLGFKPKGNGNEGDKSVFSAGAKYAAGPLSVAATYETKRDSAAKAFSSIAGSYDLGAVKLMAGYANGGNVSQGGTGKGYSLGFNAPIGGFNVGALLGKNSDNAIDARAYEFWINKEVLKNTIMYFETGNAKYTGGVKGTGYALGVIYVF